MLNDCMMNVMRIVLTVLPAIPFLSIMTNIAKGNILELLDGLKPPEPGPLEERAA